MFFFFGTPCIYIADTSDPMLDDKVKFLLQVCKCARTSQPAEVCDKLRELVSREDPLAELRNEHYKEASLGKSEGIAQSNKIIYNFFCVQSVKNYNSYLEF